MKTNEHSAPNGLPEGEPTIAEMFPAGVKIDYQPVFEVRAQEWKVEIEWELAYFKTAESVIARVVSGDLSREEFGITGVFLFRHYLELALKSILFHSRWIKALGVNALNDEIEALEKDHFLDGLWREISRTVPQKIGSESWAAHDVAFIDKVVADFHRVDPRSLSFRYHGSSFRVTKNAPRVRTTSWGPEPLEVELGINYESLLNQMQHVYEVLTEIDSYIINTYRQNSEREADIP